MYDSPIEKILGETQSQLIKNEEEQLMVQVSQTIGYDIDKDELIKALNYDRQQYEKGYEDGLNASRWIFIKERKPDKNGRYLVSIIFDRVLFRPLQRYKDFLVGSAIYEDETWGCFRPLFYGDIINFEDWEIIAWMPLPEPFKKE